MKKITYRLIALFLTLASWTAGALDISTVAKYATACESELEFNANNVTALNCNDGLVFNSVNDTVGHARINANVDLVFACRHLSADGSTVGSVELLIHNRESGSTCFFTAKDPQGATPVNTEPKISTEIVSPTASNADSYWTQPFNLSLITTVSGSGAQTQLTRSLSPFFCVGCHVAGPYIASTDVAPMLAQFGLLNDGHDTFATRYHSVGSAAATATTGQPTLQNPFIDWDRVVSRNNEITTPRTICASACHSIGANSKTPRVLGSGGSTLIPSLSDDIADVTSFGLMPANNPTNTNVDNSYRWVNMNSPMNNHDGEFETLSELRNVYPKFWCSNPAYLTAHVIDSDEPISTNAVPDKLNRFNLQDGLVCLNQDQPSGRCQNYQTRYMCNGRFTAFQDLDGPGGSGDWEVRRSFAGLCAFPTWIQARYKSGSTWVYVNGPADRLAQFDNKGLVCYNAEQDNGRCSNYVVKFDCSIRTIGNLSDHVIGAHLP